MGMGRGALRVPKGSQPGAMARDWQPQLWEISMQREIKRIVIASLSATLLTASSGAMLASFAQLPGGENVSMILFRIVGKDGKKFLETPTGEMLQVDKNKLARDATTLAVY